MSGLEKKESVYAIGMPQKCKLFKFVQAMKFESNAFLQKKIKRFIRITINEVVIYLAII